MYYRDPYYDRPPAWYGCLGSTLIFLFIAAIIIVCAVFIGFYILIGLLILGAVVGGVISVFALFKAIPQSVKDMSSMYFTGNRVIVAMKKIGYFFICISKYSFYNDIQYAKSAFQKFSSKRALSLSKWINLATAITVIVFGLLILFGIISFAFMFVLSVIVIIVNLAIIVILLLICVCLIFSIIMSMKDSLICSLKSFKPICFRFIGTCNFVDLINIPKTAMQQVGRWISLTWKKSMSRVGTYRAWFNNKKWYLIPASIALIISTPVSCILAILIELLVLFVLFVIVYLIDAIWVTAKVIFKF